MWFSLRALAGLATQSPKQPSTLRRHAGIDSRPRRTGVALLGCCVSHCVPSTPTPCAPPRDASTHSPARPNAPPPASGGAVEPLVALPRTGGGRSHGELSVRLGLELYAADADRPGHLTLAATFLTPPGTHIYWQHPGDTGLATQVRFRAPPGLLTSAPLYPAPTRFDEGGVTAFGYAERAAIFARVQPAAPNAPAAEGPWEFEVSASWLACSHLCVKESGVARLSVDPNPAVAPPPAPWLRERFAQLPVPMPPQLQANATWREDRGSWLLFLALRDAALHDFYTFDTPLPARHPSGSAFELRYASPPRAAVEGVLEVTLGLSSGSDPARRFYLVQVSPPDARR